LGHAGAQANLGLLLVLETASLSKTKKHTAGNAAAMLHLTDSYVDGIGVADDLTQALR